jgi:glycosyltransferase involved in cell wall biosynthesis
MPLYNCEQFVEASINSVISQSYGDWELIVIDDCSTDNSFQKAKALADSDKRIKLYKMPKNSGVAKVRNRAIEEARGRYLAFLDADDLWHEDKLKLQLAFMKEQRVAFSFTAFDVIDESGENFFGVNEVPLRFGYEDLLKRTAIGCLTVMYDTFEIDKCYFDTTLGKHEDYQCWLEILKKIPYAGGLNEPLAYYRVRNSSLSSNKLIAASYVWKIIYRYQKIPFFKAVYYFSHYAFRAILKYRKRRVS